MRGIRSLRLYVPCQRTFKALSVLPLHCGGMSDLPIVPEPPAIGLYKSRRDLGLDGSQGLSDIEWIDGCSAPAVYFGSDPEWRVMASVFPTAAGRTDPRSGTDAVLTARAALWHNEFRCLPPPRPSIAFCTPCTLFFALPLCSPNTTKFVRAKMTSDFAATLPKNPPMVREEQPEGPPTKRQRVAAPTLLRSRVYTEEERASYAKKRMGGAEATVARCAWSAVCPARPSIARLLQASFFVQDELHGPGSRAGARQR